MPPLGRFTLNIWDPMKTAHVEGPGTWDWGEVSTALAIRARHAAWPPALQGRQWPSHATDYGAPLRCRFHPHDPPPHIPVGPTNTNDELLLNAVECWPGCMSW